MGAHERYSNMKIAICGTEPITLSQAPFSDPTWQIWGMAHRRNHYKRSDVLFEMHRRDNWVDNPEFEGYLEWLDDEDRAVEVWTRWYNDYPQCEEYLIEEAIDLMGREYFTSSFSYILAAAIGMNPEEIGIYGMHLTADDEYSYQKPNAEYLIGLAQGKGIKITIAKGSALLNSHYVYGDGKPMTNPLTAQYEERLASLHEEIKRVSCELDQLTGAEHEVQEIIKSLKDVDRGAL